MTQHLSLEKSYSEPIIQDCRALQVLADLAADVDGVEAKYTIQHLRNSILNWSEMQKYVEQIE